MGRKQRHNFSSTRFEVPGLRVKVKPPEDGVRMSEVLAAYAQPLLEGAQTEEDYKLYLTIASYVWNAALLPPEEQEPLRDRFARRFSMSADDEVRMLNLFEMMRQRKQALFGEVRRAIVNFDLQRTAKGFGVNVASTPLGPEAAGAPPADAPPPSEPPSSPPPAPAADAPSKALSGNDETSPPPV